MFSRTTCKLFRDIFSGYDLATAIPGSARPRVQGSAPSLNPLPDVSDEGVADHTLGRVCSQKILPMKLISSCAFGGYRALFELEGSCLVVYEVGDIEDISICEKIMRILGTIVTGALCLAVVTGCGNRTPHAHKSKPLKFAKVERLANGGSAYYDGNQWWYYNILLDNGSYSANARAWVSSTRSPAEYNFQTDTKTSSTEEVEVGEQGQPENGILTEAEVSEMESQVNDMMSEGNPNNQETDTATETETSDTASDSGGGDAGGGGGDAGGGGGD